MRGEVAVIEPKRGRGQPTLYRPEYCDQVIAFCTSGKSLTAFAGTIGVARRTITHWREAHAEFDDACEIAKAKACAFWEDLGIKIGQGEGGPGASTMVSLNLQNYGAEDFRDRRQVEHIGHVDHRHMTYQQALAEAKRRGLPMRVLEEAGLIEDRREMEPDDGEG